MIREVISALRVWDAVARREILLPPGTVLTGCQIRRHGNVGREEGPEAYAMEFRAGGQTYTCPLFLFQPRTEPADQSVAAAAGF